MPRILPWRRIALVATLGAAALFTLPLSQARAEGLVACFAGGNSEELHAARRPLPPPIHEVRMRQDLDPGFGFAPSDAAPARRRPRPRYPSAALRMLALRRALQDPAALAALILVIGDMPDMPQHEGPVDPGPSVLDIVTTPSTTPPTAPEPTALFSGLVGFGLTGAYALLRRRAVRKTPRWRVRAGVMRHYLQRSAVVG